MLIRTFKLDSMMRILRANMANEVEFKLSSGDSCLITATIYRTLSSRMALVARSPEALLAGGRFRVLSIRSSESGNGDVTPDAGPNCDSNDSLRTRTKYR